MKEDFNNYKKINKTDGFTPFSAYFLLKILYYNKEFYEELLNNEDVLKFDLLFLEKKDYVRIIDNIPIITPKGKILFETKKDEVEEVITYFNELKLKYLNIKLQSKCKTDIPAIKQRIKDYGLDNVKNVLFLKFHLWNKDKLMRQYLTSMSTLLKASNFEGYINQIELIKETKEIKQSLMDTE